MKKNFSDIDFQKIFNIFNGNIFNVRVNKGGNISLDVKNLSDFNIKESVRKWYTGRSYVFYMTKDGILIRSVSKCKRGTSSIFPLNMNSFSRRGKRLWWDNKFYYSYSTKLSSFENVDDAIIYFIDYLYKYHNIINF